MSGFFDGKGTGLRFRSGNSNDQSAVGNFQDYQIEFPVLHPPYFLAFSKIIVILLKLRYSREEGSIFCSENRIAQNCISMCGLHSWVVIR